MPNDDQPEPTAPDNGGRLVTLADAAETLGVSVRTVRRLIAHGYLEGYRVGPRAIRVRAADVEAVLTRMPEGYAGGEDHPDDGAPTDWRGS